MNETLSKITDRFIRNYGTAGKVYKLDGNLAAVSYAAALMTSDAEVTEERLKEVKKTLSKYGSGFVNVKNTLAKEVVAAIVAESPEPDYAAQKINDLYSSLIKITPGADFYGVPASVIFKSVKNSEYESTVDKVKEIYQGLKKYHPFLTSYEDVIGCTLMALSDKGVDEAVSDCEACHNILKEKHYGYFAQDMACILSVFGTAPEEKCKIVSEFEKKLKDEGISFANRALPTIAAVAMTVKEEDIQAYMADVKEISDRLKSVRGLGNWGVGKKFRNLISASIVASAYQVNTSANIEGAAVGGIVSTMFIQQLTMVVCMASVAGMAYLSSNSNNPG